MTFKIHRAAALWIAWSCLAGAALGVREAPASEAPASEAPASEVPASEAVTPHLHGIWQELQESAWLRPVDAAEDDLDNLHRLSRRLDDLAPEASRQEKDARKHRQLVLAVEERLRRRASGLETGVPRIDGRVIDGGSTCADAPAIEAGVWSLGRPPGADSAVRWLRFQATADGFLTIDTHGSSSDTELALFHRCDGELLGENDDARGLASELGRELRKEQTVWVRLRSTGEGTLHLRLRHRSGVGLPGEITGTVTDAATGAPVAGVRLWLVDASEVRFAVAFSDGSGHYALTAPEPGDYWVRTEVLSGSPYVDQIYDGVSCPRECPVSEGVSISVAEGQIRENIDFALIEGLRVTGRVQDQNSGTPVADARVTLYDPNGEEVRRASTDDVGRYRILGVLGFRDYRFEVSHPHYRDELWQDVTCDSVCNPLDGDPFVVEDEDLPQTDVELRAFSAIAGRVTDAADGDPLRATVTVYDLAGAPVTGATAAFDGTYRVGGLAPGSYYVVASQYQYLSEVRPETPCDSPCDPTVGTPVVVEEDRITVGVDFTLDPFGTVSGTLLDDTTGAPVSARVRLFDLDGLEVASVTASQGAYSLKLPPTTVRVTAEDAFAYRSEVWNDRPCPDNLCVVSVGDPVNVVSGVVSNVGFALSRLGEILGTVSEAGTGKPAPGVGIYLYNGRGLYQGAVFSAEDGTYGIPGLEDGTYFVRTFGGVQYRDQLYDGRNCEPSCVPTTGTPLVIRDEEAIAGVDFELTKIGSISGTLRDAATGLPPGGTLRVFLYNAAGLYLADATPDAGGRFELVGLAPATYFLGVSASDHIDRLWEGLDCFPALGFGCAPTDGTPIVIASGTEAVLDIALSSGGRLAGSVVPGGDLGSSFQPRIEVYDDTGRRIYSRTLSPLDGIWNLGALVDGEYYVVARGGSGYQGEVWPGNPCDPLSSCLPAGTPVTVVQGEETGGIHFVLAPHSRVIGRIFDGETGEDLYGGSLALWNVLGGPPLLGFRGFDGAYAVEAVPPGTYRVGTSQTFGFLDQIHGIGPCEEPDACDLSQALLTTVGERERVEAPDFYLDPAAGIQGRVTDGATGAPLSGVAIDFWNASGEWIDGLVTGSDGRYDHRSLGEATYFVTTDTGSDLLNEVWDDVACPLGPAYEGLCDPLLGQGVPVAQDLPVAEVSFALDGSVDFFFADGFEEGDLGAWDKALSP